MFQFNVDGIAGSFKDKLQSNSRRLEPMFKSQLLKSHYEMPSEHANTGLSK